MSTEDIAIVQSRFFGGLKGKFFNDVENVLSSNRVTVNADDPITEIKFLYGEVIDGFKVTYSRSAGLDNTVPFEHGTVSDAKDHGLTPKTITFKPGDNVIAITGLHGDPGNGYGDRIVRLNFLIYNSKTGDTRLEGGIGGKSTANDKLKPFFVTANGQFIAFSGYAENSTLSVEGGRAGGSDAGLYGLSFYAVEFRSN
ncbi:hypothetical protein DFH09DRAFT_151727 [Mycena vulgaris]|nr:hypothetical protein DFH09DRAFT_1285124 [Mycena vulgaris]KAJ6530009.1 hypothetical protein DFH09DRAFT_151727 [Mycena vulgaris]